MARNAHARFGIRLRTILVEAIIPVQQRRTVAFVRSVPRSQVVQSSSLERISTMRPGNSLMAPSLRRNQPVSRRG